MADRVGPWGLESCLLLCFERQYMQPFILHAICRPSACVCLLLVSDVRWFDELFHTGTFCADSDSE